MIGPPGSGKTMLARRLPGILPHLSREESLETTRIHSVAGMLPPGQPLIVRPPFRAPHHTVSDAGLIGGGSNPSPGEISLAHNGVLFLDELPEFRRNVLESLRQPMEERKVVISRAGRSLTYPAGFTLVAAMNPCPCGFSGDSMRVCTCPAAHVRRYLARVSGPLLDRVDIHVEVPALGENQLTATNRSEGSAVIRMRVQAARERQRTRFQRRPGVYTNAQMGPAELGEFCRLDDAGVALLKTAVGALGLSARAYHRVLKIARTIADLADERKIGRVHVAEAIQYRSLDRGGTM
jgi:magnesium chelatase family protein